MTNIVMIARDRHRLTYQALRTLYENTPPDQYSLVIVDDGSQPAVSSYHKATEWSHNCQVLRLGRPSGIVGLVRNLGAWFSERHFGRGDYLYFSDNDVAFLPGWLDKMLRVMELPTYPVVGVLGGYRHPFHQPNLIVGKTEPLFEATDAVAGYSMLIKWKTWDQHGPFEANAQGVCKSEDFALCQKIVKVGDYVGYIHPPVLLNCGITNSEGKPAIGAEHFLRVEGYLYE